ncbi:ImmA/IrrE family metallo-endopeptidase [Phormidium sp. CCY1219]|uniref:ImmA/IrrE family metallo-endopeptidase n=1 Tax=Phormidium sp. CCY1219 TaxID=2886104 RepID=UPI002D1ECF78|nr:ImmA/IrrE family metallo-endopeptidase [Phormidium sp. CCY1219]MEB3828204.1 ImmA/IrrE family metallo-endopeptidase [Phormidium sp. CCY1219]
MSIFKPYRYYRKEAIEYRANHLLRQMDRRGDQFAPRWPFDVTLVADFLDLGVIWECIPPDEIGPIAARILPLQSCIEINEQLLDKPQGFQESTLAHEIGHWVLHINQDVAEDPESRLPDLEVTAPDEPFVCRGTREVAGFLSSASQLESIEWQAQYFASCLLMPRHILEEKSQGRDLTRWPHLYEMREELGVSISNLVNRLQDLEWIYIPKRTRQIYPGKAVVYG